MIRDLSPIRILIFLLIPDPGSRGQKGTGSRYLLKSHPKEQYGFLQQDIQIYNFGIGRYEET
jgi:hypothetical protein